MIKVLTGIRIFTVVVRLQDQCERPLQIKPTINTIHAHLRNIEQTLEQCVNLTLIKLSTQSFNNEMSTVR